MGVCSSCLSCFGLASDDDAQHATAPLLQSSTTYGTAYPPSPQSLPQQDPNALHHEREYLDRIVAQTSENLIDIFAPAQWATPGTGGEWYQKVLEGMRAEEVTAAVDREVTMGEATTVGRDDRRWLEGVLKKAEEAVGGVGKVEGVGKLVVGLEIE